MAANAELAGTVVGFLGCLVSLALYLSPLPTIARIWQTRGVEHFQPYPYLAQGITCVLWMFYWSAVPVAAHSLLISVVVVDTIGMLLAIVYLTTFIFFAGHTTMGYRAGFSFLALILASLFIVRGFFKFHSDHSRIIFIGAFASISNIMLYASPLAVVLRVIGTQSIEFMPVGLSVCLLANGVIWTLYAVIQGIDWFLLVSNAVGAILAVVQLVVYAYTLKVAAANRNREELEMQQQQQQHQ